AMKQVAGSLKMDLAQYRELEAFTQFGSDLDKITIAQLERGKRLSELLKQDEGKPMAVEKQVVSIFAGTRGFLDECPVDRVRPFEAEMLDFVQTRGGDIFRVLDEKKALTPELEQKLQSVLKEFCAEFKKTARS
ncbi:MAG: F0F1 ATP synthase subunit alpha, partial [Candidatus Aminicenantes bacterium]|nr:F0F1 ATP synthase subunit alpha [Candidatus Aminicenantes bacterium]